MIDSIIFDLDGTLWDATYEMTDSWNLVLEREGYELRLTREEIAACMGMSVEAIANTLLASFADPKERMRVIRLCLTEEEKYLSEHGGKLMSGLTEVLSELKKDYKLYIVSNCQEGYIQVFLNAHQLWEYFDGFICAGDSGMSKGQNNLLLMQREKLQSPVYVGDTKGDMESALEAGIPFVFCRFGFGQVSCGHQIDSLGELPEQLLFL